MTIVIVFYKPSTLNLIVIHFLFVVKYTPILSSDEGICIIFYFIYLFIDVCFWWYKQRETLYSKKYNKITQKREILALHASHCTALLCDALHCIVPIIVTWSTPAGERLGRMQSLAGLAAMLRGFSVAPGPHTCLEPPRDPTTAVVQSILGGIPLRVQRRK